MPWEIKEKNLFILIIKMLFSLLAPSYRQQLVLVLSFYWDIETKFLANRVAYFWGLFAKILLLLDWTGGGTLFIAWNVSPWMKTDMHVKVEIYYPQPRYDSTQNMWAQVTQTQLFLFSFDHHSFSFFNERRKQKYFLWQANFRNRSAMQTCV